MKSTSMLVFQFTDNYALTSIEHDADRAATGGPSPSAHQLSILAVQTSDGSRKLTRSVIRLVAPHHIHRIWPYGTFQAHMVFLVGGGSEEYPYRPTLGHALTCDSFFLLSHSLIGDLNA